MIKKKLKGGNFIYSIIKLIEDTAQWIIDWFAWLFSPIYSFSNNLSWLFKPDGAMPCTWSHLYYLAFIFAIILFIIENIIIIFSRASSDLILKNLNLDSFNINQWINFPQFILVLLVFTFLYKFGGGELDIAYLYVLLTVIFLLFQKGIIIQILYLITGIWLKI